IFLASSVIGAGIVRSDPPNRLCANGGSVGSELASRDMRCIDQRSWRLRDAGPNNHPMKIATWNINGVKARIDGAVTWLKETNPEVACFQEIKCTDEAFPAEAFEALGYNCAVHGQKGFNGVAILSKRPLDEVAVRGLP